MSATLQGSNELGKAVKREASRRSWTPEEDDALLAALKELVVHGWKSDNGSRPGIALKLQDAMRKAFPLANIKASPHITSKMSSWRRNHATLVTILSRSGIGFNLKGDHMIEMNNEQWEDAIRKDSNAKNMRGKPWPMLESWKEVFGKDRATGDGGADVIEIVIHLIHDIDKADAGGENEDYIVDLEDNHPADSGADSVCQATHVDVKAPQNKKRKAEGDIHALCELLGDIQKDTNARLTKLADGVGYQADLGKARKEVFTHLQKIPSLSLDDMLDVGKIMVEKSDCLEMFMGLPDDARLAFVGKLMKNVK